MNQRIAIALFLAASTLLLGGCESESSVPPVVLKPGPHRGSVRSITGESGFVEVVNEPVKGAAAFKFRLAVYFLNADLTEALKPVPTEVRIEASWPDAAPRQTLDFTPEPASGDLAGAARFVSKPIESDASPSGILSAKLGDKAITAAL